jgi:hypothetical protein
MIGSLVVWSVYGLVDVNIAGSSMYLLMVMLAFLRPNLDEA